MHYITRPSAPFYVQFELTQACNHKCFFCYNETMRAPGTELTTDECKRVLDELREMGVFSINFNGGEPLARLDFFAIAKHAKNLGFDIHLNTNATLINGAVADKLALLFPSLCTSVLASTPAEHDKLVGAQGAFARMRNGVDLVLERGMKVEINVCTFRGNYRDLYDIARVMAKPGVHVFCVTRYIMVTKAGQDLYLRAPETIEVLALLERISADFSSYAEVKLPGPVPFCELPQKYWEQLRKWNTPCMAGYGLCRISPEGSVTPCPLSDDIMGNVREKSMKDLWNNTEWNKYARIEHLPHACSKCQELEACRGGCVFYDDCLKQHGLQPQTQKWDI